MGASLEQTGGLREKCAVVGVLDADAAGIAADALIAMQHRGSDSTGIGGITAAGDYELYRHPGKASEVYTSGTVARLRKLGMVAAIGHDRYATSGPADKHHQPVRVGPGNRTILLAENGNISDIEPLEADALLHGIDIEPYNDSELKAHSLGARIARGANIPTAVRDLYPQLLGAFSTVVLGKHGDGSAQLTAFRDHHGVRPFFLGRTASGGHIVGSETIGLEQAGGTVEREIEPGELITIGRRGIESYQLAEADPKFDLFELIYFSDPDSTFKGVPIRNIRYALGQQLAEEYRDVHSDSLVLSVPNSAIPYAKGFADSLKLEYGEDVLVKRSGMGRSFMGTDATSRALMRDKKYEWDFAAIKNRHIVVIDDSIVRSTTAPHITGQLHTAGALSVTFLSGSSQIRFPNYYGVDMPYQGDLIAARMDDGDIQREVGCNRLGYISFDGMLGTVERTTGEPAQNFEVSCFTGVYPIPIGKRDIYIPAHHTLIAA